MHDRKLPILQMLNDKEVEDRRNKKYIPNSSYYFH